MKYLSLLIVFLLVSCSNSNDEFLIRTNTIFTKIETEQIVVFIKEFDTAICNTENISTNNVSICYQHFLNRLPIDYVCGPRETNISEVENNKILATLSPNLKKEFWTIDSSVNRRKIPFSSPNKTFNDTIPFYKFNPKGKYLQLVVTELSQQYPKIDQLSKHLLIEGNRSMHVFGDMLINYKEYNLKDDRVRLMYAVQFTSLVDSKIKYKKSYDALMDDISKTFKNRRKKAD